MVKTFLNDLLTYLSKDKVALSFLIFMVIVLILNIIKEIITAIYRKKESQNHTCKFLKESIDGLSCTHRSHLKKFKKKNCSCDGCFGRTIEMSKEEAEESAGKINRVVNVLFVAARAGKSLLPYISIIFTLLSAMSLSTP